MAKHPSRRALRRWAAGTDTDIGHRVEDCAVCLAELETLTALEPRMRRALAEITRPDARFMERIEDAIDQRRRGAEDLAAFFELFSLGWRTLDTLVNDDD